MFFLLFILFLIGFSIYMWISDGYIYIASNHFEKELSVKKMKEKTLQKNTCKTCGAVIPEGEKYCENCKRKQLTSYSSSNEFGDLS